MIKALLVLLVVLALGLGLYANLSDAQATVAAASCPMVVSASAPNGLQFCESLKVGHLLWAIVFYAALAMAGLAAAALLLLLTSKA